MSKENSAVKTISKPFGVVEKLWKRGYNPEEEYRPLSFLIFKDCEDGLLIQNAVSGELILVDKEEWKSPSVEAKKVLVNKHFLVPQNMDDKKYIDQLRTLLSMTLRKRAITNYTILPTSCCNARCFYCFESEYKQATMSEETAQKVVDYIVEKSAGNKVKLGWFGGEPMLGIKTIDYISSELSKRGVEFYSTMISNGYLFDEAIAEKAKNKWKLRKIQITLDGTEEVYNSTKNYKYKDLAESPYQRVLRNIELLAKNEIKVSIRLNMSLYNVGDIKKLVNELVDRFKDNKYIYIYCMVLFEDTGFEPVSYDADVNRKLFDEKIAINDVLASRGFRNKLEYLPVLKNNSCMADNDSAVVINPLGQIAKCEQHCMDRLVGDIDSGITDKTMLSFWKEKLKWNICDACPLYPLCYKLKGCDTAYECKEYMKENKILSVQKTMEYRYKDYLNKNSPQEYVEEDRDFDD